MRALVHYIFGWHSWHERFSMLSKLPVRTCRYCHLTQYKMRPNKQRPVVHWITRGERWV